jgi:hypothetical protein
MNTYNTKQVNHALNSLNEIFADDKSFAALPADSRNTFALALLQACNVKPKPEAS